MCKCEKKEAITYSRCGEYLVPNLVLDNCKVKHKIDTYRKIRLEFLRKIIGVK